MYQRNNPTADSFTASPDKYPQGRFKDKACRTCGETFSPIAPSHLHCSDACSTRAQTDRYLTRNYGITFDTYSAMHATQGGLCALCGGEGFCTAEHHQLRLVVDHCHATGRVRGLLCHNCNRALGLLKDNVQTINKAIAYLEGATTIPQGSTAKRLEAHSP